MWKTLSLGIILRWTDWRYSNLYHSPVSRPHYHTCITLVKAGNKGGCNPIDISYLVLYTIHLNHAAVCDIPCSRIDHLLCWWDGDDFLSTLNVRTQLHLSRPVGMDELARPNDLFDLWGGNTAVGHVPPGEELLCHTVRLGPAKIIDLYIVCTCSILITVALNRQN